MTKRDDNKQFNRRVILDAARKVFSREGFAKANTTQIIEISGFSTGTFYNYFQTKEELMEELSLNFLNDFTDFLYSSAATHFKSPEKNSIKNYIDELAVVFERLLVDNSEDIALITRNQIYFRDLLINHPKWQKLGSDINRFIEDLITNKEEAALTSQIILGSFVIMFAYKNNHPEVTATVMKNFMKKYLLAAFNGFES